MSQSAFAFSTTTTTASVTCVVQELDELSAAQHLAEVQLGGRWGPKKRELEQEPRWFGGKRPCWWCLLMGVNLNLLVAAISDKKGIV